MVPGEAVSLGRAFSPDESVSLTWVRVGVSLSLGDLTRPPGC